MSGSKHLKLKGLQEAYTYLSAISDVAATLVRTVWETGIDARDFVSLAQLRAEVGRAASALRGGQGNGEFEYQQYPCPCRTSSTLSYMDALTSKLRHMLKIWEPSQLIQN